LGIIAVLKQDTFAESIGVVEYLDVRYVSQGSDGFVGPGGVRYSAIELRPLWVDLLHGTAAVVTVAALCNDEDCVPFGEVVAPDEPYWEGPLGGIVEEQGQGCAVEALFLRPSLSFYVAQIDGTVYSWFHADYTAPTS